VFFFFFREKDFKYFNQQENGEIVYLIIV